MQQKFKLINLYPTLDTFLCDLFLCIQSYDLGYLVQLLMTISSLQHLVTE